MTENNVQQAFPIDALSSECPLSYIGGKRWLAPKIKEMLVSACIKDNTLVSPFCGGSSIEISIAASGIKVIACDRYDILINFYTQFRKNPSKIGNMVLDNYPINPDKQHLIGLSWGIWNKLNESPISDNDEIAALTWFVNKNSWRGVTFFRPPQIRPNMPKEFFTEPRWVYWQNKNIIFEMSDYKDTIEKYNESVLYLDPPYLGREHLYNHYRRDKSDMDHIWLKDYLISRKDPWILSHDWTEEISEMYKGVRQIRIPRTHGFNKISRQVTELLITNI